MRVKTWKILSYGSVPQDATMIPVACQCGREAQLPVVGRVIAVLGGGSGDIESVLFDNDPGLHALPAKIQCRRCGRIFELERRRAARVG